MHLGMESFKFVVILLDMSCLRALQNDEPRVFLCFLVLSCFVLFVPDFLGFVLHLLVVVN